MRNMIAVLIIACGGEENPAEYTWWECTCSYLECDGETEGEGQAAFCQEETPSEPDAARMVCGLFAGLCDCLCRPSDATCGSDELSDAVDVRPSCVHGLFD